VLKLQTVHELKMRYKWRLFVDECLSIGVLGRTGRGVAELFDVPADCIEIKIGSLETTLASVGGFCVGTQEVVRSFSSFSKSFGLFVFFYFELGIIPMYFDQSKSD
jgi:serine palmitoyltransferase